MDKRVVGLGRRIIGKRIIEICPAKLIDIPGIFLVQRATWLETYPNKKLGITRSIIIKRFFKRAERIAKWRKSFKDNKRTRRMWVAKYQNRVVAFCVAVKSKDRHEIGAIYILPKFQNLGIGGALTAIALDWLGGKRDIYVCVAYYNKKAIKFYKKFGFRFNKKVKMTAAHKVGAIKFPEIEMVKAVSNK